MVIPLAFQFRILLFSLLAGIITGLLFDLYRVFRGFNNSKVLTVIEDMLFWVLCALLVFVFLLYTNYAFVGVYVYLYIALGVYLYLRFFSKYFLKIQYKLLSSLAKFFRVIFHFLCYPFKLLFYDENKHR